MNERIYVYDRAGAQINDPEALKSLDFAVGLRFDSLWPKGYFSCSFTVSRDMAIRWAVKNAYEVIIRDGRRIVWQGLINVISKRLATNSETYTITASGFISLFAKRVMRKKWVDNSVFDLLYQPLENLNDVFQYLDTFVGSNVCGIRLPGNTGGADQDLIEYRYDSVSGDVIVRVDYTWQMQSGDGLRISVLNVDNAKAVENTDETGTGSVEGSSETHVMAQGDTASIIFEWKLEATDTDYDGFGNFYNAVVYVKIDHIAGVPDYYADQIIRDVITRCGESELSADFDDLASPGFALIPFMTQGKGRLEIADSIIQRAVDYGDGSQQTWGFSVWDETGTSDGLPKTEFKQRPALTDWDYEINLSETSTFHHEETLAELFNYVHVEYTDTDGKDAYASADNIAALKDTTSITNYGRRDKIIPIGKGTSAKAQEVGERFLALHKDPLNKGGFTIKGRMRKKGRNYEPASWVRAGIRVKVNDYLGGKIFLIRKVAYNAENMILNCEFDLPADSLAIMQAQDTLGLRGNTNV